MVEVEGGGEGNSCRARGEERIVDGPRGDRLCGPVAVLFLLDNFS